MWARFVAAGAIFIVGVSRAPVASAQSNGDECASAYTQGQEDRLAGRLFAARRSFLRCAADACPKASARDCRRWVSEVEADLPTARIRVRDVHGDPIAAASVSADGEAILGSALVLPVILEAGPHQLRVEAPGYRTQALEIALRPSDRELPVDIVLHAMSEEPPSVLAPSRPVPALAIAFASVGVLALGSSLYFGLRAHSQYEDLKSDCAPYCPESASSSVHQKAVAADVSLLVSAAALGAATWLYLSRPDRSPVATVSIAPQKDGAALRFAASF